MEFMMDELGGSVLYTILGGSFFGIFYLLLITMSGF